MPTFTVPKNALAKGPGTLFWTTPGVAAPTNTVAGSVFTVNAWTGWFQLGITKDGHEFTYDLNQDPIQAAEYLDDIDQVTTGRTVSAKFELMQVHATNLVRALNRPTPTTSGATTTLLTTVTPPGLGAELYCQIGWQAQDDTERFIAPNAFQIGSLTIARKKGADVATLPVEYKFFPDASGNPVYFYTAGDIRGGTGA